jgi:hypothetical protein
MFFFKVRSLRVVFAGCRITAEGGRPRIDQSPNPVRDAGSAGFSQAGNNSSLQS